MQPRPVPRRLVLAVAFFAWLTFILAAFYLTQKPAIFPLAEGIAASLGTLVATILLLANGLMLGRWLLARANHLAGQTVFAASERLLLGAGLGLGLLGISGYFMGRLALSMLLFGLYLLLAISGQLKAARQDLQQWLSTWQPFWRAQPRFYRLALSLTVLLAFLLALAPPAEAFDALFYHLPVPAYRLGLGNLASDNLPHYWFPALPGGLFSWMLALGVERGTQFLHLAWVLLSGLLLWHWARRDWDDQVAGLSLLVLASMPSLHLLASWAYTDFTLAYFCMATLFALTGWRRAQGRATLPWLLLAAIFAGMAMGVKYTSFILPISAVLLLLWWGRHRLRRAWRPILMFSLVALLVAAPWYLRNLLQTGNPVYPFLFGGQNWDTFRAAMYADAGTGIGWDAVEIFLLPFNATLGHRDANFYDGRLGPLFLLLAPLTLWVLSDAPRRPAAQRQTLFVITAFSGLSLLFWVVGVINSSALWQTRLLFPALLPLALPTALGFLAATRLDTSHLRLSFILNFAVLGVVSLTLVDAGIGVIRRNPLAYAAGLETPAAYLGRVQPAHAEGMALLAQTPQDAKIYYLYEPRSYYAVRLSQPDPILDNFLHDLYLYQDAAGILQAWQAAGYTHILLYQSGLDFMIENRPDLYPLEYQEVIAQLLQALELQASTTNQAYQLYRLPAK